MLMTIVAPAHFVKSSLEGLQTQPLLAHALLMRTLHVLRVLIAVSNVYRS